MLVWAAMRRAGLVMIAVLTLVLSGTWQNTARAQTGPLPLPTASKPERDLAARGQALFDDQQYEESIQTLSAALLKPNQTSAQKVRVYRLLALNFITLGRKDEAESAVRALLVLDVNYALPASESPKFRNFFTDAKARWETEGRPGFEAEAKVFPPVSLKHAAQAEEKPGTAIEVRGRLTDPGARIAAVKLFFRTGSRGKFTAIDVPVLADRSFVTRIPGEAVKPPLVEYYVVALDAGALPLTSRGDAEDPLRVAIPEPSRGWVLPVVVGASVLGAGAIVGGLALAGVFKSKAPPPSPSRSVVTIVIGE
jgi:tetratricopeptide (TPR) repeat protein